MDYIGFKQKLLELTGLDLNSYKEQQMQRRILQWVSRHKSGDLQGLIEQVRTDTDHRHRFLEYLTINTSNFFRDPSVFKVIESKILPAVLAFRPKVQIWSAGCSIGAEVYSIAMLLLEQNAQVGKLLATDLDEVIIAKAKQGAYIYNQVSTVPEPLLKKYFSLVKNEYVITDKVKRMVTFAKHNLLQDPFYKDMDLILCRNVFIYFTNDTQRKLTQEFVNMLRPRGYFIVGSAEQIMNPASFGLTRVSYCIYQKD